MQFKRVSSSNKLDNEEKKEFSFDFGQLISKHPIRWKIWGVLRFYNELNINQISQFMKASRYTVSRHLKSMERDNMVISREIQPEKRGKYAPKYYHINPEMLGPTVKETDRINEYVEEMFAEMEVPEDPKERFDFYKLLIKENQTGIMNYSRSIGGMNFIYDYFEKKLPNIKIEKPNTSNMKIADDIFNKYLGGINEPYFLGLTFDKKHFKKFKEIHKEYWKKLYLLNIDQLKNPDPEGPYYALMTVVFPSKAILELKRKKFQEENI